ncbi:hypothetical protein J6590_006586 [Homalodisca vitripennis]|nr:hypothetical protein J6590_006586 [Homalodisca vitripennis]
MKSPRSSCPCKQPACPAIGGGSEVTFKPLIPGGPCVTASTYVDTGGGGQRILQRLSVRCSSTLRWATLLFYT